MVKLEASLQKQINDLIQSCGVEYQKGNNIEAIKILEKAWELLPNPKVVFDDSYHIAKYIIQFCLLAKDYVKAKRWSNIIFICDLERADSGEREFLAGKVAFDSDDLDIAKEFFFIANKKSEGRCFVDEDTKYLKFFKK
jgi:hypothetical protein